MSRDVTKDTCLSQQTLHRVACEYEGSLLAFSRIRCGSWQIRDRDMGRLRWRNFRSPLELPRQGWKIHLSVAAVDAVRLVEEVLPFLVTSGATFKLPATLEGFVLLNSGHCGRTQIGKTLTVYPRDDVTCRKLCLELDVRWRSDRAPTVLFDFRLGPRSSVYLRYGAITGEDTLIDALGRHSPAIRGPDGNLVADRRDTPGGTPTWAFAPVECIWSGAEETCASISVGQKVYLPLRRIHYSAKGEVFLGACGAISVPVVIKTARPGVNSDQLGLDAIDRLANEFKILNCLHADGANDLIPEPLGFETGNPAVLILQDVPGAHLNQLPWKTRLHAMPTLMCAVAELHALGYVHRDIKLSNAVLTDSGICLLDFELASHVDEPWPLLGNTRGYNPPEGAWGPASSTGDCYALGIALAHALLEYDPSMLPLGSGRLIGLLQLVGAYDYVNLVSSLTARDPSSRPRAAVAAKILDTIGIRDNRPRSPLPRRLRPGRSWIFRAAAEAARSVRAFRIPDGNGYAWRNNHLFPDYLCESINIGAAGIILGLSTIATALRCRTLASDVGASVTWLASRDPVRESPGLFTGNAGVALAMSVGAGFTEDRDRIWSRALDRLNVAAQVVTEVDLFSGAAGVIWAGCLTAEITGDSSPLYIVRNLSERLMQSAKRFGDVVAWENSGSQAATRAPYVGAAHGAAGIALALAHWGRAKSDQETLALAREVFLNIGHSARALDQRSLKFQAGSSSTPAPIGSWCHGRAGYLWCLLHAFGDEPQLAACIDWAAETFGRDPFVRDPTLCHGLAGQLELCRMLRVISRHRLLATRRATCVAATLRLLQQRRKGLITWSSENPETFTPDLWVGSLGPAASLAMSLLPCHEPILSGPWLRQCLSFATQ